MKSERIEHFRRMVKLDREQPITLPTWAEVERLLIEHDRALSALHLANDRIREHHWCDGEKDDDGFGNHRPCPDAEARHAVSDAIDFLEGEP